MKKRVEYIMLFMVETGGSVYLVTEYTEKIQSKYSNIFDTDSEDASWVHHLREKMCKTE